MFFLFALSYSVIPELAEWRQRYEHFWCFIAVTGIIGWVLLFVLVKNQLHLPPTRLAKARFILFALLGVLLGWSLWQSGWLWYWGTDQRQAAEIACCVLAGSAWSVVLGEVFRIAVGRSPLK